MKWDSQLGMSMSFGEPRLEIVREPYTSKSKLPFVREHASFRRVRVRGQWWLWIFCAHWTLKVSNSLTATGSSSYRKKAMAMARLEGQRLTDIKVNPVNGVTNFTFDLGATLQARPYEKDNADIWTLYYPHGFVLGVKGNGTFTYERGSVPDDEARPRNIGSSSNARR